MQKTKLMYSNSELKERRQALEESNVSGGGIFPHIMLLQSWST